MQQALFTVILSTATSLVWAFSLQAQATYPYSSGQAVFVQSPYTSSLYTTYQYNPTQTVPQRLPAYTTNQAVFVQRPYATAQQTVTAFPTVYANGLPLTENRYMPPTAFPTTVAPPYPFATTPFYPSSTYDTTTQSPTYGYPYTGVDYTTDYTYPYTTSTPTGQYQLPVVERIPATAAPAPTPHPTAASSAYDSATYVAYPITMVQKYPYPTTTTAAPEAIVQPSKRP